MQPIPYVDWEVAARTGRRLVAPGPELSARRIAEVVASLRAAAVAATDHVRDVSGLREPADSGVLVVDRPTWIGANAAMAQAMMAAAGAPTSPANAADGCRGTMVGAQSGAVFALVGTRILGQFVPFGPSQRLLLVAPNIVMVERRLAARPADFRLWVCLHEETHRFQFGQAPWLRDHLIGLLREVLADEEPVPSWRPGTRPASLAELFTTPAQRQAFDRLSAVMSLMEGHAEVMMDRVGTSVIPGLPAIRRAFEQLRDRPGWIGVVQKLVGLELKRAQYREGAAFCRAVIDVAGIEGFNRAFDGPGLLPSLSEIRDPQQWLHRVG